MNAIIRNNVVCFMKANKEMSKKQGILQDGNSTLSSEFQYFMQNFHNANILESWGLFQELEWG